MRYPVHYLWLVGEQGFVQSHQITNRTHASTVRHLKVGLDELEKKGVGAALVDVALDEDERTVLSVSFHYNTLASPAFRRHLERRERKRFPLPTKALPPARPAKRKKKR